jgi:hypothetical protein
MRFRLLPLMAVATAVLIAACGGSSTPTTTTKASTSHKSSSSQPKTSTSASANTTAATNTGAASSSSTSKPTFASVSNCTNLSGVGEQFAKAMSSATSGGKFDLSAMTQAYHNLADAAPSAIRSDVQVAANAFAAYASDLQKAGYKFGTVPSASQIAAIESAVKTFDSSKLKSASAAIQAWAVANCK